MDTAQNDIEFYKMVNEDFKRITYLKDGERHSSKVVEEIETDISTKYMLENGVAILVSYDKKA